MGREWAPAPHLVANARGGWTQYVWAPFTVMELPLSDLVQREGFHLNSFNTVSGSDRPLREIAFSYIPSADEARDLSSMLRGGQVTVDPSRKWCIVRSRLDLKRGDDPALAATWVVDYENTEEPFPRVRSVETSHSQDNVRTVGNVESLEFTTLPRSDFTLTAFGFPEPGAEASAPLNRRWLLVLGAAVIAVACALFIRAFRRVKGTRSAPAP